MVDSRDVVVAGGGLIGLAAAWRLAQQGLRVTVADPEPLGGASRVAAGMLAPVSEVRYGEEQLLALGIESLRRFPAFAAELADVTGLDVGLRQTGTVVAAADAGDRAQLAELQQFHDRLGLSSQLLTSREARALEPMLAPSVRAGLFVAGDGSVDNRRLGAAVLAAATAAGVTVVRTRVHQVDVVDDRARGVVLEDRTRIDAGVVIVASGAWATTLDGLPDAALPPVRPVKGQILRLRGPVLLDRSVRGLVNGTEVYLVPRTDGELVVGATVEDMGFDERVTAGGVYELLRDAREVVPGVAELELVEVTAGLRPGSPDNRPVIGRSPVDGLVLATGHYRNGILLTPITADLVVAAVTGGDDDLLDLVSPLRFAVAVR